MHCAQAYDFGFVIPMVEFFYSYGNFYWIRLHNICKLIAELRKDNSINHTKLRQPTY